MKTFLHSSKDKQSFSDWSLRQKAGFFVFLALFAICIGMACFFNGFSLPNLLILIAIAIVSMVIYVLPISLHPVVKACLLYTSCVRPSGTEPKIKLYYGVKGSSMEDAENRSAELGKYAEALLG